MRIVSKEWPELRHDLVVLGGLHQGADLADGMGQGLLAIDVLAPLDGRHGRHGVRMVGRADDHRVDLVRHLVEHLAEVLIDLGVRELRDLRTLAALGPQVHVAQGDDLRAAVAGDRFDVAAAHAASADAGDVQSLTGRRRALPSQDVPGYNRKGRRPRGRLQESSSGSCRMSVAHTCTSRITNCRVGTGPPSRPRHPLDPCLMGCLKPPSRMNSDWIPPCHPRESGVEERCGATGLPLARE
jgi:hypothetical protein